jgi:hypothetical protein
MQYDMNAIDNSLMSPMHNMGSFEFLGVWGRCWFDLGTSDLIAIDILINALYELNKEYVQIDRLIIGGENEDWRIDNSQRDAVFNGEDNY